MLDFKTSLKRKEKKKREKERERERERERVVPVAVRADLLSSSQTSSHTPAL